MSRAQTRERMNVRERVSGVKERTLQNLVFIQQWAPFGSAEVRKGRNSRVKLEKWLVSRATTTGVRVGENGREPYTELRPI